MKTIQQWFAEYSESHQNPTNKCIHWIAVPIIYFTIFGLLWQIPMPFELFKAQGITWPLLLAVPALAFYFRLSFAIGLGMTVFTALVVVAIRFYQRQMSEDIWLFSLAIFVIAWVMQFIGHRIEGKKPSFFKDVQFLLIGPAWLLGFLLQRLGVRY